MSDVSKALVSSLIQRWDADPQRFAGLMSKAERDAIQSLLGNDAVAKPAPVNAFEIKRDALSRTTVDGPQLTVCFDFGTARSKAFAAATFPDGVTDLIEIPLGDLDNDIDGSLYAITSSVWIDNSGLLFAGSEAIRRSQAAVQTAASRSRIDSLKHLVSLAPSEEMVTQFLLPKGQNPTGVPLMLDDVVVFFLAYLTDLASSYLASKGHGRYLRRRFTLPCWPKDHRQWSTRYLAERLAAAQLVADTFSGQWAAGIPAAFVHQCVRDALASAGRVRFLVDAKHSSGVLEPLAAGSTRVWRAKNAKEAVLVLDIGAGTTDISLFWVTQLFEGTATPGRRAFPIVQSEAIRIAGDFLDDILIRELLHRAHLDLKEGEQKQAEAALRLFGVRRLKEQLFTTKILRHRMSNDLVAEITLEEFMKLPAVLQFQEELESRIRGFLGKVHPSWQEMNSLQLVFTGGGCDLPMVTRLAGMSLPIGEKGSVRLIAAPRVPQFLADYSEALSKEYPQLAVAMGGALPEILDERADMTIYPGAAKAAGALERFPVQGL